MGDTGSTCESNLKTPDQDSRRIALVLAYLIRVKIVRPFFICVLGLVADENRREKGWVTDLGSG